MPCFDSHEKMNMKDDHCKKGRVFLSCSFWLEVWFLERRGREEGEERKKWACNRGGKARWWGLFRVWLVHSDKLNL